MKTFKQILKCKVYLNHFITIRFISKLGLIFLILSGISVTGLTDQFSQWKTKVKHYKNMLLV